MNEMTARSTLSLAQMRAFAAVARHRHFTRAAAELGIAQPSVSYQVRELERQLGVRLVELVGRRVLLTDAGEHLAARGVALLNDLADLERELRDHAAGRLGRLRLGATRTVGGYALSPALGSFRREWPDVELRLQISNTAVIEQLLLDREVDLAVVEWKVKSPRLVSRPLRRDALVLVAPPDHHLCSRERISREDLRGESLVARELGSGTRALSEEALGSVLADVRIALELDQPEAILRTVAAGIGLAFISESIAERDLTLGRLRKLPIAGVDLWRDFSLVSLGGRVETPAMRAFAAHVAREWSADESSA